MNLELLSFLTDRNRLWAIDESVLLGYKDAAERHDGSAIEALAPGSTSRTDGLVAILNISGPISHKPSIFTALFGGAAVTTIQAQLRQVVADDAIKAVVLNLDTPGGTVTGIAELAAEIRAARDKKPIIAHTDSMAASAGFWLAANAGEITASRSAVVGSIGVITAHADISQHLANEGVKVTVISAGKHKAEGSPFAPLSDVALAEIQGRVNAMYGMFVEDVAAGRGVSASAVRGGYGEGRAVFATEALTAGMIDRIATLDQTIARLSTYQGRTRVGMKADAGDTYDLSNPAEALRQIEIDAEHAASVHDAEANAASRALLDAFNSDEDRARRFRVL